MFSTYANKTYKYITYTAGRVAFKVIEGIVASACVKGPFVFPSHLLPPSFLFSLFLFISGWIRVTYDCAVCVGQSQGRLKGGGEAHSQTKLGENGKPF